MLFRSDPNSNSYTLAAFRVMQGSAVIMILLVAGLIAGLKLSERLGKSRDQATKTGLESGGPEGQAVGAHA